MTNFDYEKLRVYQSALRANTDIWALLKTQRRYGSLEKQIERAGESILLNIAEGAGEFSPPDKARFYRMALRSASETAAALDLLARRNASAMSACTTIKDELRATASMLTGLIHTMKSRRPTQRSPRHPK